MNAQSFRESKTLKNLSLSQYLLKRNEVEAPPQNGAGCPYLFSHSRSFRLITYVGSEGQATVRLHPVLNEKPKKSASDCPAVKVTKDPAISRKILVSPNAPAPAPAPAPGRWHYVYS
jgi:hypothetical protein